MKKTITWTMDRFIKDFELNHDRFLFVVVAQFISFPTSKLFVLFAK